MSFRKTALSLVLLSVAAFGSEDSTFIFKVADETDLPKAREILRGDEGASYREVVVQLAPGRYLVTESLHINRSGVTLIGEEGVELVLADGANVPVIAVGTQADAPTESDVISNIQIFGVAIDGNKEYQDSELVADLPWIRNNGIDIRAVRGMLVSQVSASNNRSGGLVISWRSSDIHVSDSVFERNYFDGVAYYDSVRVYTTNCVMRNNIFAGVSLDNDFADSAFIGCDIDGNGAVGIFARNSYRLRFNDCVIRNSSDWGIFLAHDDAEKGVHDLMFASCEVIDNRGGLFVASEDESQSSETRVVSTVFRGNEREGRRDVQTSGSGIWAWSENALRKVFAAISIK